MASGNIKSMKRLAEALSSIDRIRSMVANSLADECLGLIAEGFRAERDPYGDKWKPKQRRDGRKTLSGPTNRLKTGWHRQSVSPDAIVIAPSVDYAAAHQDPQPRQRLSNDEAMQRSLSRGFSRKQVERSRQVDHSFVGPVALKRPRRMMVPDAIMGMPTKWSRALNESANETLAAVFGGGRGVSSLRRMLKIDSFVGFKVG